MAEIITITDTSIVMVQGDTLAIGVEIVGITEDLDASFFSCKAFLDEDEPIFQMSLGDGIEKAGTSETSVFYKLRVPPEATEDLAGKYFYNWEIQQDGDVFTIMKGCLYIEQA